jgi:hypothetical protein
VRGLIVVVLVIGAGLGWIVRQAHIQRDAVAAIWKAGGVIQYEWQWRDGNSTPLGKPWAPTWLVELIGVDYFGHVTLAEIQWPSTGPDALLAQVGRLTQLDVLISSASLSDAGLVHLQGLTKLELLDISGTKITDARLVHLKGLTNLFRLVLDGTQVTDAGLAHLKGLTNLESLNLANTRVTDAGVGELKRALPGVTIHH